MPHSTRFLGPRGRRTHIKHYHQLIIPRFHLSSEHLVIPSWTMRPSGGQCAEPSLESNLLHQHTEPRPSRVSLGTSMVSSSLSVFCYCSLSLSSFFPNSRPAYSPHPDEASDPGRRLPWPFPACPAAPYRVSIARLATAHGRCHTILDAT